ncbi:MAG: hypothetical protein JXX14_00065 [Deltaproteobacteria bacterium]|nr:hypothetical protein [Deltaproteobacteria bacterium]
MFDHIKPIIQSALREHAPDDALFQARDIFETILAATQKSENIPEIVIPSAAERAELINILLATGIHDDVSFKSLLGCIDVLLDSNEKEHIFQARRLFGVLLKSL